MSQHHRKKGLTKREKDQFKQRKKCNEMGLYRNQWYIDRFVSHRVENKKIYYKVKWARTVVETNEEGCIIGLGVDIMKQYERHVAKKEILKEDSRFAVITWRMSEITSKNMVDMKLEPNEMTNWHVYKDDNNL